MTNSGPDDASTERDDGSAETGLDGDEPGLAGDGESGLDGSRAECDAGADSRDGHGPSLSVAVVGAETPGNIGTIARSMKNFGLTDLLLVDPPPLDPEGEAYGFAGQARDDILPNAREISFDDLIANYHTVGTTATTNEDETSHIRYPFSTPAELADRLVSVETDTCIVFGRERVGLTNEELARLDEVCSIPAAADYPVLNLGQAATIVLYELRSLTLESTQHPTTRHQRADERIVEALHDQFDEFTRAVGHPAEKRGKARRLWRRFVGRAHPTGREATTLLGLLRRATQRLDANADASDDASAHAPDDEPDDGSE